MTLPPNWTRTTSGAYRSDGISVQDNGHNEWIVYRYGQMQFPPGNSGEPYIAGTLERAIEKADGAFSLKSTLGRF